MWLSTKGFSSKGNTIKKKNQGVTKSTVFSSGEGCGVKYSDLTEDD